MTAVWVTLRVSSSQNIRYLHEKRMRSCVKPPYCLRWILIYIIHIISLVVVHFLSAEHRRDRVGELCVLALTVTGDFEIQSYSEVTITEQFIKKPHSSGAIPRLTD